jgi:isopentenyl-diphosphate Delta-isomerase
MQPMPQEEVILVDESDTPLGTMEKMEAHRQALLHRAFSVFIFNSKGEMLLQQRAAEKYHSAGLWTNACCSHPRPGEDTTDAAIRRLREELGFTTPLKKLFDFTYKSEYDNGLTEFEFDHVYVGTYDQAIYPDKKEVSDYSYRPIDDIKAALQSAPDKFTTWFHLAFPLILEKTGK